MNTPRRERRAPKKKFFPTPLTRRDEVDEPDSDEVPSADRTCRCGEHRGRIDFPYQRENYFGEEDESPAL